MNLDFLDHFDMVRHCSEWAVIERAGEDNSMAMDEYTLCKAEVAALEM